METSLGNIASDASAYERLAPEYYSPRHVTSRNFDATTSYALGQLRATPIDGPVLEVGAGRGRAHEYLGVSLDLVTQLDNSPSMLNLVDREQARLRVLHDAETLPFPDGEFSCVLAFLCDAFLGLNFLSESRRILRSGGLLLGTTPAYEWGAPLRTELELDTMETRFVLESGDHITAPSALYQRQQLRSMIEVAGFARERTTIEAFALPRDAGVMSHDILRSAAAQGIDPIDLPILYVFIASVG